MLRGKLLKSVSALMTCGVAWGAQSFTVAVYNVENLFDADGVAVYDDYQPEIYTSNHVITKVTNAASILAKFRDGKGPDIVLLQEMEIDQTPDSVVMDMDAFLADQSTTTLERLRLAKPLPERWRGAPSEAWMAKALAEFGASGYTVITGSDQPAAPGSKSGKAIKCVTLTKFPVRAVREYPTASARNILEVEVEVDGSPLFVFNNHWKSGAGSSEMEALRLQNAGVLRKRLDEIFAEDPQADVIIGGDLNAHYNQKARYPQMPRTGIDDVLKAQGNEQAMQTGEADLYNLWFELPEKLRGSDTYRGEWGTLMHLIISRGLYDQSGIQYQDNSFGLARMVGLNADSAGAPFRWSAGGEKGAGYSDHLPIYAHFRTLPRALPGQWMPLTNPSTGEMPGRAWLVDYSRVDLNQAMNLAALAKDVDIENGSWTGTLFKVKGSAILGRDLKVHVRGKSFGIYAPQREIRDLLMAQSVKGKVFSFYGELGTYQGNWQFVVKDAKWVQ